MKTLKNQIIKSAGMMIILISLLACRTDKFLQTKRAGSSEIQSASTRIEENSNTSYHGNEMISINDSSDQTYHVNIYPQDTFSFSIREGFKGKASKMEINGIARQVVNLVEEKELAAVKQESSKQSQVNKTRKEEAYVEKVMEKMKGGWNWIWICLVAAGLLVFIWIFRAR